MTRKLTIYTEGLTDAEFLGQILQFHFNAKLVGKNQYHVDDVDVQILFEENGESQTGGVGQYIARKTRSGAQQDIIETMRRADEDFILILDADSNRNHCASEIEKAFYDENHPERSKIVSERLYTWPNNEKPGDVEDLLKVMAVEGSIFKCWDQFVGCLGQEDKLNLHLPDNKKLIYTYLDLVGTEPRPGKRDFTDARFWNMNHEWVTELVEFIKQRINQI